MLEALRKQLRERVETEKQKIIKEQEELQAAKKVEKEKRIALLKDLKKAQSDQKQQ